jgi:hypothetical protein
MVQYGELGGVICEGCGQEVFRILEGRCMKCRKAKNAALEQRKERQAAFRTLKRQVYGDRRRG